MPRERLRILHLFIGSVPGGVLRYVVDVAQATREAGGEVVLAGQKGDWHPMVADADLPWLEIPIRGGVWDLWRSSRELARVMREKGVDIIHAHHRRATLVGRMTGRRKSEERREKNQRRTEEKAIGNRKSEIANRRVPLLYTLHLTDMPMGIPWRWFTDFGDHCHAPSVAAKRWLMEVGGVAEERITVIPHGVRPEKWPAVTPEVRAAARRELAMPGEGLVGAYVGRLEDPKNEDWVLELAAECRGAGMAVKWLMAGDGPNRGKVERRIGELGLGHEVKLLGDCDPLNVYRAADLLVLPSSREGFSYACAEAMSCGVPVLRTRTAGTEEMIVEQVTGRSCAIEKGAFISAGVEMLKQGEMRLREMGQAAAVHVRKELTFQRQVAETMALYARLAGR